MYIHLHTHNTSIDIFSFRCLDSKTPSIFSFFFHDTPQVSRETKKKKKGFPHQVKPSATFFIGLIGPCSTPLLTHPQSIFNCAQYVTADSQIYCKKVKMYLFSLRNWFFCTKIVQLAVAGKRRNTVVHLPKRV